MAVEVSVSSLALAVPLLHAAADDGPAPEDVTPGLLGFVVVAVLALALWFLLRSMNSRLRNVKFDETERARKDTSEKRQGRS
jgi:hypothetical protein